MMLCLYCTMRTLCSRYGLALPNIQFASSLILRALANCVFPILRIEGREGQQSLMQSFLLVNDAIHLKLNQINIIVKMINKKFSELFMRKETNKKQEHKQPVYFDQNFFHCRLIKLIRLQTQVKQNGQPLDEIKCKWFIKNSHDFKEIQDVTSEYYQPCLDDVGSIICVQIEPFIEGKKYNGIIIMKQSELIEIDYKLEEDLNKFLQRKQLKFDGRLETVFSQNQKYQAFEMPAQIKIEIIGNQIHFYQNGKQFESMKISSEYPNIEFIRKSFNSIILNFNDHESYKLSFNNNFQRDLFTLITRTLSAHTNINPQKQNELQIEQSSIKKQIQGEIPVNSNEIPAQQSLRSEESLQAKSNSVKQALQQSFQEIKSDTKIECKSATKLQFEPKSSQKLQVNDGGATVKEKVEQPKQNNTLLILKLDEQGKELKLLRRQLDELRINYNIQKQSKKNLETQNDDLKNNLSEIKKKLEQSQILNKKMAQISEDNRFYKNEIAIVKKQLKSSKEKVKDLEIKIEKKNTGQKNEQIIRIEQLSEQINQFKRQKLEAIKAKDIIELELQRIKQDQERIENENHLLRKKLESLQSQRSLPQPKPQPETKKSNESEQKIIELQMKLKNLQMLLKYKSNQGDSSSNFQLLVNKLTQTISEKEIQLNQFKKINKNLLEQLKFLKQKSQ